MIEKTQSELDTETAAVHKESLEGLTKSPYWGMLRAFVEDQTKQRMNHIMLTPVTNEEEKQLQNFMKGECAMGHLLLKFMEDKLTVAKDAVELYRQQASMLGE